MNVLSITPQYFVELLCGWQQYHILAISVRKEEVEIKESFEDKTPRLKYETKNLLDRNETILAEDNFKTLPTNVE